MEKPDSSGPNRVPVKRIWSKTQKMDFKDDRLVYRPLLKDEKQHPPRCLSIVREKRKSRCISSADEGSVHHIQESKEKGLQSLKGVETVQTERSKSYPLDSSGEGALNKKSQEMKDKKPHLFDSGVSMCTERSKNQPPDFSDGGPLNQERFDGTSSGIDQSRSEVSGPHENQTNLDSVFKVLEDDVNTFVKNELNRLKNFLCPEGSDQQVNEEPAGGEENRSSNRDALVKIAVNFLRKRKQEDVAEMLQNKTCALSSQQKLKSNLLKKFECMCEGHSQAEDPTFVSQIYTELSVTEDGGRDTNDQREQTEAASKPAGSEASVSWEDVFKPSRERPVRTLMTKGAAGIGKTVLTQKYILDWAEDKAHHDIQFIFPFTFRELNLQRSKDYSLVELIHYFFSEIKKAGISRFEEFRVLFILDGLDECRPPLDFQNAPILQSVTMSASVHALIINLIRGNLLPSARLWITTRPAAANQIPPECVDMVKEVRGFTDSKKEEYFRKKLLDEELAKKIISHIGTSRSLHVMCHIPVFCWITATVLDHVLKSNENKELPKTLTELYIHFLTVQFKQDNAKYHKKAVSDPVWNAETKKVFLALGKLAFEQLEKGNLMFHEEDLKQYNIDIDSASVYSGLFTEVSQETLGLNQERVFCFVHLSVQEFLAALYVSLMFMKSGVNLMRKRRSTIRKEVNFQCFYQKAVDQALESPNGHQDLFVCFLLGLSLKTNQTLLQGLLKKKGSKPQEKDMPVEHIKNKIRVCPSAEKSIPMFYWLNELNDHSLEQEIQQYLMKSDFAKELTPSQWSALAFILTSSQKDSGTFDLKKFSASKDALTWLQPVVKESQRSLLSSCNLSWRSCILLVPVLTSESSRLRELDLSSNNLRDSGVNLLSQGLSHSKCRLEVLSLSGCLVTEEGCANLAKALSLNPSHLRELDLSFNHPGESGLEPLSAGLQNPNWKLETLKTDHCGKRSLEPSPERFFCELTLDPNTADRNLLLSDNNKLVVVSKEKQPYPDHPERFDGCRQLLCNEGFKGRFYWEVRWKGSVRIGVTYEGIKRKGERFKCCIGRNKYSWGLLCTSQGFTAWHNNKASEIEMTETHDSNRIAMYLDWTAGTVSFFYLPSIVSSIKKIHLHTFQTTFTEPLYPAFGLGESSKSEEDSSVFLSQFE